MKFAIFQHVPYESPGFILEWIQSKGYSWQEVNFYDHPGIPDIRETENLIVMGGPMNIFDDEEFSWLSDEREFIKSAINHGKKVFGICLGAQFIADALGASVYKNKHTEIGWFDINVDRVHLPQQLTGIFPDAFETFHWHCDTFDQPPGTQKLFHSEATANQGFVFKNVAAFQFHMEMTADGVKDLVKQNQTIFEEDLPYVHKPGQFLNMNEKHEINRKILFRFLDKFFVK